MSEFGPDHWQTETITPALRFVERQPVIVDESAPRQGSRMILQQRWQIVESLDGNLRSSTMRFEWRDVPMEAE